MNYFQNGITSQHPTTDSNFPHDAKHVLGAGADPRIVVVQKPLERLATLARDEALPCHAAVQIAQGLPIREFISAEFRALATEVTGMAATGKLLIGAPAAACPAKVTGLLTYLLLA